MSETPLPGGSTNAGSVVRVGDTIRRPRTDGHEVVEALLLHLEHVGFDAAPRFRGVDDEGRQVLDFVDGSTDPAPLWQNDDDANARHLGCLSELLRRLHSATRSFSPPTGCQTNRPLPLTGDTWTHGDVGDGNVVYDATATPIALIDWEFAAPADRLTDPAGLLAFGIRGPRPDASDNDRRARAAARSLHAIADGYEMSESDRARLAGAAAVVLDDAAGYFTQLGRPAAEIERVRWRSAWFRANATRLFDRT